MEHRYSLYFAFLRFRCSVPNYVLLTAVRRQEPEENRREQGTVDPLRPETYIRKHDARFYFKAWLSRPLLERSAVCYLTDTEFV